ncbi:phospholipase A1 member A [Scaptodrosophila lebanonensis]|uniref:Phospholipase A1 member A n=1 Tax=Drosophila lebanonensis TaxID=7225 RepID=A0A6J2UBN0_DROLE|nr:phospholipase A1 member A [Scaptodrosophila lebanonensis]
MEMRRTTTCRLFLAWCLLSIGRAHISSGSDSQRNQDVRLTSRNNNNSIDRIQRNNIEMLTEQLNRGWRAFCDAPVDEGVMALFPGISPSDARLHVMTITNQSVELPIKAISQLRDYDISPERKTLLYVSAFHTVDSYFSVQEHLALLQSSRRDLNVIIVDFAKNVAQLYYAVRHHISVQGYFIYKVLGALTDAGIAPQDITVAGHSVGANIAALGAELFAKGSKEKEQVGQLIAIDPATMCRTTDILVRQEVAARVVVLHGEGDQFGVRVPLGHVDIYPNGIGYFPRRKLQPGCETKICSHMYPFILFMEALIEGVMIPATKCTSWAKFRQSDCSFENTLNIGLVYPKNARGLYFCVTQPNPPFTYMEHGLRYKTPRTLKA